MFIIPFVSVPRYDVKYTGFVVNVKRTEMVPKQYYRVMIWQQTLLTEYILTCHSRKTTSVSMKINDDSFPLKHQGSMHAVTLSWLTEILES